MRVLAATGIAVAVAALSGGAEARDVSIYRGVCGAVVPPSGQTGLESELRIETACGRFAVDGHGVRFLGPRRAEWNHVGLLARRGRLVFYEHGRILWRSRAKHYRAVSWVAESRRSFAFMAYGGRLHIADFDGPERAVGRLGEYPLGWTRAGLLVTAQKHILRARTRTGRLARILETRAGSRMFDTRSRALVYVSRDGAVVRTDGRWKQRLALRVGRWVQILPLEDDRVALLGRRVVVLDSDGSIVASDRRHYNVPAISSQGAIAMISTGPLDGHSRARESVRLLRPGERSSKVLFATQVGALGCGHWPTLAWRGEELLYATSEGHVVVITPGSGEHLDLTRVVRRLPGRFLQAHWA